MSAIIKLNQPVFNNALLQSFDLNKLYTEFEAINNDANATSDQKVKLLESFRFAIQSSNDESAIRNAQVVFDKYAPQFSTPSNMLSACRYGFKDLAIVFSKTVKLDIVSFSGKSLLHYAADNGHTDTALWLIRYKAPLEMEENDKGRTPFHLACLKGNLTVIKALRDQRVNVNCSDKQRYTPLHLACLQYQEKKDPVLRTKLALRLVAAGCNPSFKSIDGKKASAFITSKERIGLLPKLLKFPEAELPQPFVKDIWIKIFGFLPNASLANEVPLVSKKFKDFATETLFNKFFKA